MNKLFLLGWSLLPIAGVAYHYGPGQEQLLLDDVARMVADGDQAVAKQDWFAAEQALDAALQKLPTDRVGMAQRLRVERAKVQMHANKLPAAEQDLDKLVDELESDRSADPAVRRAAREALANAQYYMTWLMRLEGLGRDVWEPEVEAARQNFRLLAEAAATSRDGAAEQRSRQDLESAIKLARMDIKDLQGLPLPSQ